MKYSRVDILVWGSITVLLAIALMVNHDWSAFKAMEEDLSQEGKAVIGANSHKLPAPGFNVPVEQNQGYRERDPFSKIQSAPVPTVKTLALNGIVWDTKTPVAIINGEVARVGEEVSGYKVVAIYPRQVVLDNGIEEIKLELPAEDAGL